MDRVDVLGRLDRMVEPGGAIALFRDDHPKLPDNAWHPRWQQIVDAYGSADPDRVRRKSPDWLPNEAIVLDSPFCVLERISVIERRRVPADQLVDRAMSMSSTTSATLGERVADLVRELREAIAGSVEDGQVREVVETSALVARRPDGQA
jgi:hypothetical protein